MKKLVFFTLISLCFSFLSESIFSQVVITDNPPGAADPAAVLDVQSTSRGFLFPRMSQTDRDNISSPPTGLVIFQTDNTPGFYYNTGTAGTPDWQRITDASTIGGYWSPDGSNIFFNTGNVGVGENSPSHQLHVNGASMFENDSVYITGRPGKIFLDAESGYDAGIRFGYTGGPLFKLFTVGASTANPYIFFSGSSYPEVWGMRPTGRVWHDYKGTIAAAYVLRSSAAHPSLSIENSNSSITNISHGIQVTMPNVPTTPGTDVPAGITVFIEGDGTGVYVENQNHLNKGWMATRYHGVSGEHGDGHRGTLGTSSSGVYGVHGTSDNTGILGLNDYGVQGVNDGSGYWAAIGASTTGVYARLGNNSLTQSLSPNDFAVKGIGVENGTDNRGSNYANQVGGIMGYNTAGTEYSAGVWGFTDESDSDGRTSGVFGGIETSGTWGALGYEDSGNSIYGGYFTSRGDGSGKAPGTVSSSIGVGIYGDLFGAHVDGEVYGLYSSGNKYGLYSNGDLYRTGADVHIQKDIAGHNTVMYTLVSPEMTIQTYGIGQMSGGKANINFDQAFASVVSDDEPIIVTVTPIGESEGVHLINVDSKGFSAVENRDGKSNGQFMWVAIGKRKGYENISLPADVIADDYDLKISEGLHNDADMTTNGKGLYYSNGSLSVGNTTAGKLNSGSHATQPQLFKREGILVESEKSVKPNKAEKEIR